MAKQTKVKAKPKAKKVVKKAKPKAAPKARKKTGLSQITYSVSAELQEIVKSKRLTRPQIVKQLWAYIKAHKCQDAKNKRMIVPDQTLSVVLGKKPVDMLKLAGLLNKHISK